MRIFKTLLPVSLDRRRRGVGISGIHRSGKTTLAKGERAPYDDPFLKAGFAALQYVDLGTSSIAARLGLLPAQHMDVGERMNFQSRLLDHYRKELGKQEGKWCTDRTFLDLAAYTLSDPNVEKMGADWLDHYLLDCSLSQNEYFNHTYILTKQHVPPTGKEGKYVGVDSSNYNKKFCAILIGFAETHNIPYTRIT